MHSTMPAAARGPVPLNTRRSALTPRGDAALSLYRFLDVLRELEPDDRAFILEMLKAELMPTSIA